MLGWDRNEPETPETPIVPIQEPPATVPWHEETQTFQPEETPLDFPVSWPSSPLNESQSDVSCPSDQENTPVGETCPSESDEGVDGSFTYTPSDSNTSVGKTSEKNGIGCPSSPINESESDVSSPSRIDGLDPEGSPSDVSCPSDQENTPVGEICPSESDEGVDGSFTYTPSDSNTSVGKTYEKNGIGEDPVNVSWQPYPTPPLNGGNAGLLTPNDVSYSGGNGGRAGYSGLSDGSALPGAPSHGTVVVGAPDPSDVSCPSSPSESPSDSTTSVGETPEKKWNRRRHSKPDPK